MFTDSAEGVDIFNIGISADKRVSVEFLGDTNSYFVLRRGENVLSATNAVSAVLGDVGISRLIDANPPPESAFYRIQQVTRANPIDADSDGIDDLFELLHPSVLDPLNPFDSIEDPDSDGLTSWAEYRLGMNPFASNAVPWVVAGSFHFMQLTTNGILTTWGKNDAGQLGDGTTQDSQLPRTIPGSFSRIAAGDLHSLALNSEGTRVAKRSSRQRWCQG